MKKVFSLVLVFILIFSLAACGKADVSKEETSNIQIPEKSSQTNTLDVQSGKNQESSEIKIKVTVGEKVLTATLIDNATTRNLISKFPLTVPMMNLYSREMCYRFADPLPANEQQESGYEVGDLSYWSPRHSLVIFYSQNGEVIGNLQKIGHFDSNVEFFKDTPGDANVKFELLDKQ